MTLLRFLCDENIPRDLGLVAKAEGFDVPFAIDLLRGRDDEDVLAVALSENRVLIIEDADFGRLIFAERYRSGGVVLVRIAPWKKALRKARLHEWLGSEAERLRGHFTMLSERTTRIRPIDYAG